MGAKWYDPFKKAWNFIIAKGGQKRLELFLKKNINENTEILELGCGTALNLKKIFDFGLSFKNYLGVDFTQSMLNIAQNKFENKKNVKFEKHDITKLDHLNKKFDVIICTWVLSHLEDPIKFVNVIQKHLQAGGELFLVFYTKPKWYLAFWFKPVAENLFYAKCLDKKIVKEFKNVKETKTFASGLTTIVEIKN